MDISNDYVLTGSDVESKDLSADYEIVNNNGDETATSSETVQDTGDNQPYHPSGADVTREQTKPSELFDILGNGTLMKKILKEGQGFITRPEKNGIVTINAKGTLEDGTVVDQHSNFVFSIGEGDVMSAWDVGIATMEKGEIAEIYADSRHAFGEKGRPPEIPPSAKMKYEIELVEVLDPPSLSESSFNEVITLADRKRERGNFHFLRDEHSHAINSYSQALKLLTSASIKIKDDDQESTETVNKCRLNCYNNLAAAQIKIEGYPAALQSCDSALRIDPQNVKALFRKAKILSSLGETDKAINILKKAVELEPASKHLQVELNKLKQKRQKEEKTEKTMYKKMFGLQDENQENESVGNTVSKWGFYIGAACVGFVAAAFAMYRYNHN